MRVVRTIDDLRRQVGAWRADGATVGFVPTMGALHEGHLSLMRTARGLTDRTMVSLFVNPRQFGPGEDLDVYPRDEAGDVEKLTVEGVDLLYAPGVEVMYPPGAVTTVSVPGIGDILEGEYRPGFFTGVATVVAKLLVQAGADVAVFGEKDYQQLQVIRRLAADLDIPGRIVGGATVREADGLALSSRNAYLSAAERAVAPALFRALDGTAAAVRAGTAPDAAAEAGRRAVLAAGFAAVDYLTVRDAETLLAVDAGHAGPKRVLAAARLGATRLIDNVAV